MAAGFVENDGDGGGEVERAGGVGTHGNSEGLFGILGDERFWEAFGFAAENEEVVVLEFGVPRGFFAFGAE